MNFLLDMGISPRTAIFLRQKGHQASHLSEQQLGRLSDHIILAKARQERAILLTHDLDFADLMAASGAPLPSVILFRLRSMRAENVNRFLWLALEHHSAVIQKGVFVTITEGNIRIRLLPIQNPSFS